MKGRLQTCMETVALDYLERGFSIFPLPARTKSARIKWKQFQTEHASPSQVSKWFTKPSNLAIVTGDVSRLVVRDFDDKSKYREWKSNHIALATTAPTVATASGFHVYLCMEPIPRLKVSGVGSGELRGTGGYVVAPPSIHPSGKQYSWTIPLSKSLPIVTFSDLDLEHLSTHFTEEDGRGTEEDGRVQIQKPYREERERVPPLENGIFEGAISASIPSETGQRERKLFDLARRLKAYGELSIDQQLVVFDQWWDKSKDIVGTKCYEVSMNAFLRCVDSVTTPLEDVIGVCMSRAENKPIPDWSSRFCPQAQLLAGLCRELQLVNGNDPFFLSCRSAGDAIGVSHTVANQFLQLFVRLKKIEEVTKGSAAGNRATRYRYVEPA